MKNMIQMRNLIIFILLIFAPAGSVLAVVAPSKSDIVEEKDRTSLYPKELERLYFKLQKISSEMEEEQTHWQDSLTNIKEELHQLESYFQKENQ